MFSMDCHPHSVALIKTKLVEFDEQRLLKTTLFWKQRGMWRRTPEMKERLMHSQAFFSVWILWKSVGF